MVSNKIDGKLTRARFARADSLRIYAENIMVTCALKTMTSSRYLAVEVLAFAYV